MTGQEILFINSADTGRHISSANASIYPHLGLLTLMSNLKHALPANLPIDLRYLDGALVGNVEISNYLRRNGGSIRIACFSVVTSNYGAAVSQARLLKQANPKSLVIFGNDHFSALYRKVMENRSDVDVGFFGNDVVRGFVKYILDTLAGKVEDPSSYWGMVYRDSYGKIIKVNENRDEHSDLSDVEYSLADSAIPHISGYLSGQQRHYSFMRDRSLRATVIDVGRGCIKFSGERIQGVPVNACDFCGIIPGSLAVAKVSASKAWGVIHNAFQQGFNYLYVTADELPLTFWPTLSRMVQNQPEWYLDLHPDDRPRLFGYSRAEAFEFTPDRIVAMADKLLFDHFFVGFEAMSSVSLSVMNKQPTNAKSSKDSDLVEQNLRALRVASDRGVLLTGGFVLTHLGINADIMEQNFQMLRAAVEKYPTVFAALDFGPLCPVPGSSTYLYLVQPELAVRKAAKFGLRVDEAYLESIKKKYETSDLLDIDELISDFIHGCCPDVSVGLVAEYMQKISDLAETNHIVIGGGI